MASLISLKKALSALVLAGFVLASVSPAIAGVFRTGRVEARSIDTWTIWVPSGSNLVEVIGDTDTDLDCYVYQNGVLLGFDDDYTDHCVVFINPARSGNIRIEIHNLGYVWNAYTLTVDN